MINQTYQSGIQSYSGRPANALASLDQPGLKKSLATTMPSERQTSVGISNVDTGEESSGNYERWKKSKIFHPKQTNAAITAENYFRAKAGFEPVYMHNIAATKMALMSISDKDRPRYSEQVNILA
mgnify:FL=1